MRRPTAVLASILLAASAMAEGRESYNPPGGFVPDAETAARIAEAVAIPIYGSEQIKSQLPLRATLKDGVWYVVGTANSEDVFGGEVEVEISKKDGRILHIIHGE